MMLSAEIACFFAGSYIRSRFLFGMILTWNWEDMSLFECKLRPCPHDTFPNRARSIATSSRPVARVHTGATGTLVPVSRDHLATWNERARSIAIGCALSPLSCGRSTGR